MNRPKRTRRASTLDRASEDTVASSNSSIPTSSRAKRARNADGREPSTASSDAQPPSPNSVDLLEELFTAVVQYTDDRGVQISNDFTLLPSKTAYPDYYLTIKRPVDLKQIATKIQTEKYRTLDGLMEDLLLMTNNALDYNAPSSQIYKDASNLKRVITSKKSEFEQRELHRTTERTVRTRRSTAQSNQPASAIYAALEYGEEEALPPGLTEGADEVENEALEGDSDDETSQADSSVMMGTEGGNTAAMEELYSSVLKLKGPGNRDISLPFKKLPSKRRFPAYYSVIRTPVSLSQIKRKMHRGFYVALDEMILDFQLMCQNAQTFNESNSIIYKDAERIKNFVDSRLKDFQEEVDRSSSPLRTSLSERLLPEYDDTPLRKRIKFILRHIMECKDSGVYPVEMFLEKPLKKDYPSYYTVIAQPIDIKTIVTKLHTDKYTCEEMLLQDIKLLCDNAKMYNEETSDIYKDAVKFEELVRKAQRTMGSETASPGAALRKSVSAARRPGKFAPPVSPLQAFLIELYEYVTEHADSAGRKRSEFFQTLPPKTELPEYYEVIKKPMDLDKIQNRIQHDQYSSVEDIIEDLGQMFENAVMFNDPNSQIHKDALVLLSAVMSKAGAMGAFVSEVPDVRMKVQEILQTLMDSVMKYEDASGRNLSDAIADCAWSESEEGSVDGSSPPLTLESIRSSVQQGRYRRLDRFQDDIFRCLETTRFSAQPDSPTYEDAVNLHIHFIQRRDELCSNGTKLLTPALQYSVHQFQVSIEHERKESRLGQPSGPVSELETSHSQPSTSHSHPEGPKRPSDERSVIVGSEQYFVGDFVYLEPYEKTASQSLIVCVEDFVVVSGLMMIKGCYMYRPHETFHVATRKFFEKEVFKSDLKETHLPTRIISKCYVMPAKDYFKMRPLGFEHKDVYVCDVRYTPKMKNFRKIKVWNLPENPRIQLVKRDKVLPAVRVPSVFAASEEESGKSDLSVQCPDSEIIDVFREPVLAKSASPDPELTFYEQKDSPIGYLKIGDCVLVKNDINHHIIKIDKIYSKKEQTYVSGTVFIFPKDLEKHSPAKLFYLNEVFQKMTEHTHCVEEVSNRCAVLTLKDYSTCRQTEIGEEQVYIMESKIQENGQLFKRHRGSRFLNVSTTSSSHATDDEIYFFEKPVNAKRVLSPFMEAALSGRMVESDGDGGENVGLFGGVDEEMQSGTNEDDLLSVMTPLSPAASAVDGHHKKGKRGPKRSPKKTKYNVSGFILYGAEHRKNIKHTQPGLSFQDTSRVVSDMWKSLSAADRKYWDAEAKRKSDFINEELKNRGLTYLEGISFKGLGAREDMDLLSELEKRILQQQAQAKAAAEMAAVAAAAATAANLKAQQEAQAAAARTCQPSTSQASNHGETARGAEQLHHSPQARPPGGEVSGAIPPQAIAIIQAQQQQIQRLLQQQQQTRPLFLTLPPEPPKVKRALHSEVFLRYLENNGMSGSQPKPTVPSWKRQLSATPANTAPPNHIPDYWPSLLQIDAETKNKGMELINKMWNTRNMMMAGVCGLGAIPTVNMTDAIAVPPQQMQREKRAMRRATGSRGPL